MIKYVLILMLLIIPMQFVLGEGIAIINATHLDSNYNFISYIYEEVSSLDGNWSEVIEENEIVRVYFEENLTNGSVLDLEMNGSSKVDSWFEVYHTGTKIPLLGVSGEMGEGLEYIELNNLTHKASIFDIIIKQGYFIFDYIHDAVRILLDDVLAPNSNSIVEGENLTVMANYSILDTGGPAGDITIGLNDTNNNLLLDGSCEAGDTFEVAQINQTLCVGCTDNVDGTITFLDPDNGEDFFIDWILHSCPDSKDLSPANLLTYEITATNAVFDNSTGNITIEGAPIIEILFPINDTIYNTPNLFIRTNITGNTLDICWYDINGVNTTFTCNTEPNITATEGANNLIAYVNNSAGLMGEDSINFVVNSSIPLTVGITSPANGTYSTALSPKLKILAYSTLYSSVNYTLNVYYANNSFYSFANNGTLQNNSESEITLDPSVELIGNSTAYKFEVNVTDEVGNNASDNIYYTVVTPAVELISPLNDYWDGDGNISFSFKVYDEAYPNISCSLYLDGVLNQTNVSALAGGALTTFNVTDISEGAGNTWRIYCIDASNNTGEDSRTFNVDKTSPIINWINDTPDPLNAGSILNITANITDNIEIDYVKVNISGAPYYMIYSGEDIYYYEYNTTGLSGDYNYSVKAYDQVENFDENNTGSFYVIDCQYIGPGNWEVNCSNNCVIDSNIDVLGNNISIVGSGSFTITANITGFKELYIRGVDSANRCEVYCSSGGCFQS